MPTGNVFWRGLCFRESEEKEVEMEDKEEVDGASDKGGKEGVWE